MTHYTLGLDFGTDSVRALLVDVRTGHAAATAVVAYPRWAAGRYCDPTRQQYRQHPLDYHEAMTAAVRAVAGQVDPAQIRGIGVDTTGSTIVAVDARGVPLALQAAYTDEPAAQFILWKDHTAVAGAEAINALARRWPVDYTRYSGGVYSGEWFWAKILHLTRSQPALAEAAHSWLEHCDYIPYLLTGQTDVSSCKRSRCAAGHKALWHPDWGGLPPADFLDALHPGLGSLRERLYTETYTADELAGHLSEAWATRLGLPAGIPVAVGAFDAHMGAVGGQLTPFQLSRIMGTSTCDIMVAPAEQLPAAPVRGICGQVDGSVLPGLVGLEAGQSAFGDVYAWFVRLLAGPTRALIERQDWLAAPERERLLAVLDAELLTQLTTTAEQLPDEADEVLALDWINGRRTPDADQRLRGVIAGLGLGSDAARVFRGLVRATCYGARLIVERFVAAGVPVEGIIGLGGVAKKSPYVMQTLADVLQRPVRIVRSEQTCALGAAMFAAVAAELHPDLPAAMAAMGSGFERTYVPDASRTDFYEREYARYRELARRVEPLYAVAE